jgi:hypothetical protein
MGVTVLPGLHFNPKTFIQKNETNKLNAVLTNLSAQTVILAKNSIVAFAETVVFFTFLSLKCRGAICVPNNL